MKPSLRLAEMTSLWPLFLPLLFILPGISEFPYPAAEAKFSDIPISHYPNTVYLKQAILEFDRLPWWSPTILSGYPFAATPLSGIWYPPGWLALFVPLPLGFNLLAALHLVWGGWGMYLLLRTEGLSHRAGLIGGLAFAWLPKLFAHFGAGHLTLIYAVSWTPWLLIARTIEFPGRSSKIPFWFTPGLILTLIFLADPRWAAIAGILWVGYTITHSHYAGERKGKVFRFQFNSMEKQLLTAFLLSAPLWLPLMQYTALSTRANLSPDEIMIFSLPPARLLGLIFPDWGGPHEWILYPGGAILVLASLALLEWRTTKPKKLFWIWAVLVTLIFALGSHIPGLASVALIPGFSLLRVPARVLFVTGMSFAVLAAYGTDILLEAPGIQNRRWVNLGLAGLAAVVLALTFGFNVLAKELLANLLWGCVMIVISILGVAIILRNRLPPQIWFLPLLLLILIDLARMDFSVLNFHPAATVLSEQEEVARFLANQEGIFRVYSPSYSLPQQTAVNYGLELADGVEPLQLAAYAAFMEAATGVPRSGYSVTLPPYATGDPSQDNAAYLPDPEMLGLLNVRFVVSEFDLAVENLIWRSQFGETRLYENIEAMPRAWVQPEGAEARPALILERQPNQITLLAEGPGLLILSEIAYPGWQVSVDGIPSEMEVAHGLLRATTLPAGKHEILFFYRPIRVYLGLLGLILGSLFWLLTARSNWKRIQDV